MTPWILGFPLVIFAFAIGAAVWLDNRERMQAFIKEAADHIRETLEGIGRLPLILLLMLPAALVPQPAQASIGAIDIPALVEQMLASVFEDVGGSPDERPVGSEVEAKGEGARVNPETHPTPVAVEQEADLPLPPAPAPNPRPQTAPPLQPTAAQVPPVLHRIAECESGGDWTAENPRSTASGKWQFLDSTWRSQEASGDYRRAKHAPPHVQRAAAIELYQAAGTQPWNASKPCWRSQRGGE